MNKTYAIIIPDNHLHTQIQTQLAESCHCFDEIIVSNSFNDSILNINSDYVWMCDPNSFVDYKTAIIQMNTKEDFIFCVSYNSCNIYKDKAIIPFMRLKTWNEQFLISSENWNPSNGYCVKKSWVILKGGFNNSDDCLGDFWKDSTEIGIPSSDIIVDIAKMKTTQIVNHKESFIYKIQEKLDDMCVVIVHWGTANKERNIATRKSIEHNIKYLNPVPRFVLIELTLGNKPQYDDIDGVEYYRIEGTSEQHGDLFQKECLNNWAIKHCFKNESVVVFMDSDAFVTDAKWAQQTYEFILENPNSMIQPFSYWRDTKAGSWQYAIGLRSKYPGNTNFAPGFAWGCSRQLLETSKEYDYEFFNEYCFSGSGDCALLFEHCHPRCYGNKYNRHYRLRWFRNIIRNTQFEKHDIKNVNQFLMHYHHGKFSDRGYLYSRSFLEVFGLVQQYVYHDENGLLCWRDPESPVRKIVCDKSKLNSLSNTQKQINIQMKLLDYYK